MSFRSFRWPLPDARGYYFGGTYTNEKFKTYHIADHKAKVIDLLKGLTTESVKTQEVMMEIAKAQL